MTPKFDSSFPEGTHTIQHIKYNYYFGENGEEFTSADVGYNCMEIVEHQTSGEGDKWFYDVLYDNGQVLRVFNPHEVIFTPKKPSV